MVAVHAVFLAAPLHAVHTDFLRVLKWVFVRNTVAYADFRNWTTKTNRAQLSQCALNVLTNMYSAQRQYQHRESFKSHARSTVISFCINTCREQSSVLVKHVIDSSPLLTTSFIRLTLPPLGSPRSGWDMKSADVDAILSDEKINV